MKLLNHLPAWLKSKYLIAFSIFAAIMLFFDKNDLFTQTDRTRELLQLEERRSFLTTEIISERKELEALKRDPAAIERYAREKYYMKKDHEDLFIIPEKHDN
jgi:cell division protein DivIC